MKILKNISKLTDWHDLLLFDLGSIHVKYLTDITYDLNFVIDFPEGASSYAQYISGFKLCHINLRCIFKPQVQNTSSFTPLV